MSKAALVIMAAGIGSRFGGGIKQLEPVGPNGEIIMDYSIRDAVEAGFDKVIFVIRKDLEKDFKNRFQWSTLFRSSTIFRKHSGRNSRKEQSRGARGRRFWRAGAR